MLYRYKPVVQVDLETGKTVKFWMSGTEAARHIMVAQSAISLCARGGRKEAGGHAWRFASDEDIRAQDEINAKLEQEEKERKEKQRQASGEDNDGGDDDDGGGGGGGGAPTIFSSDQTPSHCAQG